MAAEDFYRTCSAKTAEDAFTRLVEEARFEYGNAGYTGTIAEKDAFRMMVPRREESPKACIERCQADDRHWSADKYGPAACVDGGPDPKSPGLRIFHFFGSAAS